MCVRRRYLDAYRIWLVYGFVFSLSSGLIYTVTAIYYVTAAHFNPLQLVLAGTAVEASIFLFEVPTGVVADVYSRRLSIIIGTALFGAAFLVEGFVPLFPLIMITEMIRGLGHTFTSGALEAWIAGEIGEARVGRAFLRGTQVRRVGTLLGITAAAALGSIRVNLPIIVGGALSLALAACLVLFMPETGFTPASRETVTTQRRMLRTFLDSVGAVRRQPVLVTFLGVGLLIGASSEGYDRLWEPHFLLNFTFPALGGLKPVAWFSLIGIGSMVLGIAASEVVRHRLDIDHRPSVARALPMLSALQVVALIGLGLTGNFMLALLAVWGVDLLRMVIGPLQGAWLVRTIDPRIRATVFSMMGQADALGQTGGGPVLGLIAVRASLRSALLTSAALLSPVLLLYARAARADRSEWRREDGSEVAR